MVQIEKTLRSTETVRMTNVNDEARSYDIYADVTIENANKVTSISAGSVIKEGATIATFAKYGEDLSVSYVNLGLEGQTAVNVAIDAFMSEVAGSIQSAESVNI